MGRILKPPTTNHHHVRHLSAIAQEKGAEPRVSFPDAHSRRAQGAFAQKEKKPAAHCGMNRSSRMPRSDDIQRVLRFGGRADAGMISGRFLPNRAGRARFAFVIPRAVDKRSTARNRLRRRIREWFRARPDSMAAPLDIVIVARKGAEAYSRTHLYEELERIASRLGGR